MSRKTALRGGQLFLTLLLVLLSPVTAAADPSKLVILLTDYGSDSVYVGLLKGAVYAKAPGVTIDSITNAVPNYDIEAGAYLLAEGCVTYPKGTVFCCVVDPGVGTSRKPIALSTKNGWYFVAPDNGLLTLVARQYGVEDVRELSNKDLWRVNTTSTTFHGRDIFGPLAGALASGVAFDRIGEKLDDFVKIDLPEAKVEDGVATGRVIRADTYGNLVTNIRREDFESLGIKKGDRIDVVIGDDHYSAPFANTYGDVPTGDRLVVVQSAGFIELAINQGSLADAVKEGLHASVTLKKAP